MSRPPRDPSLLLAAADSMPPAELDALPYGLIQLDRAGYVRSYNRTEAQLSRRVQADQIGRNFFTEVAPCTRVAAFYGRFLEGVEARSLNEVFTFTFPFEPTPRQVLVRLFYAPASDTVWVLVAAPDGSPPSTER